MKRIWMGVALTLMAHAAFAAVQYEFIQTSRSDAEGTPPMDLSARAVIDGPRSRVDFLSGNAYPPGTYVVSTDNSRKMRFVDPTQKTYTEVNAMTIASSIGMTNIKIENLKSMVTRLDDTMTVAGIATDHYRLTLNFDVTVKFSGRPLRQHFRAEIDKWTTTRFGDLAQDLAAATIQTGNAEIDELITAETTKIAGFPLKQSIRITATNALMDKTRRSPSKLAIPTSTTLTREITITSIRELNKIEAAMFMVPAGFTRSDFADRVPKAQTQVLNLEPAGN
jgi:hypothetical protein